MRAKDLHIVRDRSRSVSVRSSKFQRMAGCRDEMMISSGGAVEFPAWRARTDAQRVRHDVGRWHARYGPKIVGSVVSVPLPPT
jgi:hypothetical protein